MSEQVVVTKRGTFGRVQVTIPMQVKQSMLVWVKNSGMGKAEFLRVALMMGAIQLAESVNAKKSDEGYLLDGSENKGDCITVGPA